MDKQLGTDILESCSNIIQASRVYTRSTGRETFSKLQNGRRMLAVQVSSGKHNKAQSTDSSSSIAQEVVGDSLKSVIDYRFLSREFNEVYYTLPGTSM